MSATFYWPYRLVAASCLNNRTARREFPGALIRRDGGVGGLHPWPEFGDAPLDEQLQRLSRGATSPLIDRTLECCRIDAAARAAGRSLFAGLTIPPSHVTAVHLPNAEECAAWRAEGFEAVKLKVPNDAGEWREKFLRLMQATEHTPLRFRLDFNASLTASEARRFLTEMPAAAREKIEFAEDPCPYSARDWAALRSHCSVPLALDWCGAAAPDPTSFDVRIFKPASQSVPEMAGRCVITSSMDHPIGQMFAAWEAAKHCGAVETCGLLTHHLFEPDPFLERVASRGPWLEPPTGTGLGFDDLLEALAWKRLD